MTEPVPVEPPPSPCPTFEVFVEGLPRGKPAVRPFLRGGKPRVWRPNDDAPWQDAIALAVKEFMPATPTTDAVSVSATFVFTRPKGHYRTSKKNPGLRPDAPVHHVAKPDLDNCQKCLLDALTHCGLWRDDAQVASIKVRKHYGVAAGMILFVKPWNGGA